MALYRRALKISERIGDQAGTAPSPKFPLISP